MNRNFCFLDSLKKELTFKKNPEIRVSYFERKAKWIRVHQKQKVPAKFSWNDEFSDIVFDKRFTVHLHWVTKGNIYLTPYVCNERIIGGLQFPINTIFGSKDLITFVVHYLMDLMDLVHVASKSVNCSSHNESLKIWEISCLASILFQKRQNMAFGWAFKDPLRLEWFTNWNAKGTKWSGI